MFSLALSYRQWHTKLTPVNIPTSTSATVCVSHASDRRTKPAAGIPSSVLNSPHEDSSHTSRDGEEKETHSKLLDHHTLLLSAL